jgi:type I restriction enzyme S subunit
MKRYPEYKESEGVWIGEIPSHWRYSPLKFHLSENSSGIWGEDDEFGTGIYVLRSTEITVNGNWDLQNVTKRKLSKEEAERFRLKKGDLIITKSSGSQDHIGKTGLVDEKIESMFVCYSNFVQKIHPQSHINSKFLHYFMNCPLAREQCKYHSETTTGLANLSARSIGELLMSVPPKQEQDKIVNFLDRKTEQIDELIRIKERRVELLQEQRTALIHQTVTKGLDPNVEMKPSGVEYIGDIPKDWEISVVKHVGTSNPSKNNPKTAQLKDNPVVFLPMERVHTDGTIDQELRRPYSQLKNGYTYFEENDILIAKVTPCFENGKIVLIRNLATPVGFGSTEFIVIRPNPQKVFPLFLYYTVYNVPLRSIGKHSMTGAVGLKRVPTRFVENFKIPIPIYQEQIQIANFLDHKTKQIDELRSNEQRSIELLKEYRQTLISEVVTGKIDVRSEV